MFSDKKVDRTQQVVICGGAANACAMAWCLKAQGCKKVAIYVASFADHEVMVAAAAKKAEEEKKAADNKKAADDKKPAAGDDKKTDAAATTTTAKPDAPAADAPAKTEDAPVAEDKKEAPAADKPTE